MIVVTGAAGFIGSHLCERLVADGNRVVGVDRVADHPNLAGLRTDPAFSLVELDLRHAALGALLSSAEGVVHLAGRGGVRGTDDAGYEGDNVEATRRVVAAARAAGVQRIVSASSSSVYAPATAPTAEVAPVAPASSYARTKLVAERVSLAAGGVALRYFTVYGPRQRPDMAFARFLSAALDGHPAPLFGDGSQVRDFTYVSDAVEGTVRALAAGRSGCVYNLAGGRPTALATALGLMAEALGRPVPCAPRPADSRDAVRTHADLGRARAELGYRPAVCLEEGIRRQVVVARALSRARAA